MRALTSLLTGALLCSTLVAQDVITVMHNGQPTFYYPAANDHNAITIAANNAQAGDTILLAGVLYNLGANVVINKKLVIIGAGGHPDSTITSGRTRITRTGSTQKFWFEAGSSFSELHGLHFEGDNQVTFTTANAADGIRIKHCRANAIVLRNSTNAASTTTNMTIEHCMIGWVDFGFAPGTNRVINSIVGGVSNGTSGSLVENCVLLNFNQNVANGNNSVTYRSNVFNRQTGTTAYTINEPSTFQNNRWVLQSGSSLNFGNVVLSEQNNGHVTTLAQAFTSATVDYATWDYPMDHHVVPAFQTAGYLGTQVGIYGGSNPWKDGMLPFNPHWRDLTTPGNATIGGTLQGVRIKASAQQN